jgi:hypothetical protein
MIDDTTRTSAEQPDGDEAATARATATLSEIASQLRELAGVLVDLSRQPLSPPSSDTETPTLH